MHLDTFINRSFTSLSLYLSLSKENKHKGFWKFNSSLIRYHVYVSEIKPLVCSFLSNDISNMNAPSKRKLLKYEIDKFTIDYTKRQAKENRIIWKVAIM